MLNRAIVPTYTANRDRRLGAYVFIAFSLVWLIGTITVELIIAADHGRGSGIGDGQLVPNLHSPGGPYYPPGYDGPPTPEPLYYPY